jgi:hypothetical protein
MNRLTLKALRGSIKKWELIVAGEGVDNGVDNCPLCALFFDGGCNGCPVSEKAADDNCSSTPYIDWLNTQDRTAEDMAIFPMVANNTDRKRAARKELAFLKRLLP